MTFRKTFPTLRSWLTVTLLLSLAECSLLGAPVVTEIALSMHSGKTSLSSGQSIASGSDVTLVAAVTSGSLSVTAGQVNFCNASAPRCTDIFLVGSAQLTRSGTASIAFIPGIGSHSYKAIFLATPHGTSPYSSSTSSAVNLAVTGLHSTTTQLMQTGQPSGYTLSATVNGIINVPSLASPAGAVSFENTTEGNISLGTLPLIPRPETYSLVDVDDPVTIDPSFAIATADFNGDGIPDLAVTTDNSGGQTLSILLGKGDGTFGPPIGTPIEFYPSSIAVGDFNNDGIVDLAVANTLPSHLSILLGKGDGTFTAAPEVNTFNSPQSVATADFNGDGIADLAVANGYQILIFLGNGDGTFQVVPASVQSKYSSITVVAGDFNGDMTPDLAIISSDTLKILLGNGDGTFTQTAQKFSLGPASFGIAVADFNGDGRLDLAISDSQSNTDNSIVLGNGDGTFQAPKFFEGGSFSNRTIIAQDFDQDGIPDLAITGFWSGEVSILRGKGDGSFETSAPISSQVPLGTNSGYLTSADFNGDGIPDLAAPRDGNSAAILLFQPAWPLTASISYNPQTGSGLQLVTAAFPGDGLFSGSTGTLSLASPTVYPTVTVTPSAASISFTQTLSLTVTVSSKQNPAPTGQVSFDGVGVPPPNSTLSKGTAVLSIPGSTLSPGMDTLVVSYLPDPTSAAYYSETAGTTSVTILPTSTVTTTPTFSLAPGATPAIPIVAISDTTPNTSFYYTTDGSTPTVSSQMYFGPIYLSVTTTLQAIAVTEGDLPSAVAAATYAVPAPSNPLPVLTNLQPAYTSAGSPGFTLAIAGSGFTEGATVFWGTTALSTSFVSSTQLTAQVPASLTTSAGVFAISVQTPAPGGGVSNALQFEVDSASGTASPPSFTAGTATTAPGQTATYPVTLPSTAVSVSLICLNLPSGASCSYSAAAGSINIATSSNTPAGTYQVTVVFTESVPEGTSAGILLPILLLPLTLARKNSRSKNYRLSTQRVLILLVFAALLTGCSGASSSGTTTPTPAPTTTTFQQITSSGTVSLIVQ